MKCPRQNRLNWIDCFFHSNNSGFSSITLSNRLNLVIAVSTCNHKFFICTTQANICCLNCGPVNIGAIIKLSLISKSKGSNLLAVLLLYLIILNIIFIRLKLTTVNIAIKQITWINKTMKNIHVSGITSKIVVIPLRSNFSNWLS